MMPAKATDPPPPHASAAPWADEPERGSATLLRLMVFLSLRFGRRVGRCMLYPIAAYFFAFGPTARRSSLQYLRRALGRTPGVRDRFRHVFTFAATILDRVYLAADRGELFDVSIEGEPPLRAAFASGKGAFLLGAHLGSFEIMGAAGRREAGLRVTMAMYEPRANRMHALLRATSAHAPEIIPLGRLEAMLRIRDCLEEGKFVGMLADRTIGEAPAEVVNFLGTPALFPSGPMRIAAALRRPVIFMAGLYRGGNRYHVVYRELADFSQPFSEDRDAAVRAAVCRYVALLEEYCRSDPYNWFNFYDFWHGGDAQAPRAGGSA